MCPPCAALSMEYFEQLKLNCRPLHGRLPLDIAFEYPGLSSPSPRLSRDDKLIALMFEPRDFDLPRPLLLSCLGVDISDTNWVPKWQGAEMLFESEL